MDRRTFLRGLGGLAASAAIPGRLFAESRADLPGAADPKVVLVQYGGCVRPRETIASAAEPGSTLSHFLFHKLLPQGTTLSHMRNDLETGHAHGTLYLFTGRYDEYSRGLGPQRRVPQAPLLTEILRKDLGLPEEQVVVVHNEQLDSEFLWVSEDEAYGPAHRPGLLSLYRARRRLYARDLEETARAVEEGALKRQKLAELRRFAAEHEAKCYRDPATYLADGPALDAWWQRFLEHYEPPGARRRSDLAPSGWWDSLYSLFDRLLPQGDPGWTLMALRALEELRPRFLSLIYRDVDYVHWGLPYLYSRGIQRMDKGLWEIAQYLDKDPYYRGTTTLIVVPEGGRGTNPKVRLPFQHHNTEDEGSHEIFLYARGPGIPKGKRVDRVSQITDVGPTIAKLLGVEMPRAEGRVLDELFT